RASWQATRSEVALGPYGPDSIWQYVLISARVVEALDRGVDLPEERRRQRRSEHGSIQEHQMSGPPSPWSIVKDPPRDTSPVTTSPSQRPRFEGAVTCSQTVAREASTDQARRSWESAISDEKKGTAALYAPLSASAENDDPPPGPSRRYRVAQNATAAAAATFRESTPAA